MATTDLTGETTEILQQLIRNECVNDGTPASGGEARSVCAASSSDALMPSDMPTSTRYATGVNASVCASQTPGNP